MDMPPESVEQLLDAGPDRNAISLAFFLSLDRFGAPNLFVLLSLWPMMMEVFVVMFSGKSVYVTRRLMAIEPTTALNLLLVCELIHDAE